MTKSEILRTAQHEQVQFLRMQYMDILGQIKNVEITSPQFSRALDSEILFDGSSLEGFSRQNELDMVLVPDFDSFRILPWTEDSSGNRIATIICDIHYPDGREFEGCPRLTLKRVNSSCEKLGFSYKVGSEVEFFMFNKQQDGTPTLNPNDSAGYFDLIPDDTGDSVRRQIVKSLETMNYMVESSHHEVAPGQYEIDFIKADPVTASDYIVGCRHTVKKIANDFNLHATFMPKPVFDQYGSGMHFHQTLYKDGNNAFFDPNESGTLNDTARGFIGGQLRHARGYCAITNPLINSYKRLVDGSEAPTETFWSEKNLSPLVRLPDQHGEDTRLELRLPDPTCNPYLALAAILHCGLDGIADNIDPGEPVNKDVNKMSQREKGRLRIERLPQDLNEALISLRKNKTVQDALGSHIYRKFHEAKSKEWQDYISRVHPWEIDRYFSYY